MNKIYLGTIINTFGIKGYLKISSSFELIDKAFKINNIIIIDNKKYKITDYKKHKNFHLIKLDDLDDINKVLDFFNKEIYINREELNLKKEEYLYQELIGLDIYENNINIGIVTEVFNGENPLIKVDDKFYIPIKGNYIKKVDLKNNKIIVNNVKGLML